MSYKPPYGTLDFFFAGNNQARRMSKANDSYRRGYYSGRGQRDGRRR